MQAEIERDKNLTIEEIAARRAEEIADLQAIPEFMRKKKIRRNLDKRNSQKSKDNQDKIDGKLSEEDTSIREYITPTTSNNSMTARSRSESLVSIDTTLSHTRHHHIHAHGKDKEKENNKDKEKHREVTGVTSRNNDTSQSNSDKRMGDDKILLDNNNDNQPQNTTWSAIDTLDDVRKLAQESGNDVDYFEEAEEKSLATMRSNQVKLLNLMRDRNKRLEKNRANDLNSSDDTKPNDSNILTATQNNHYNNTNTNNIHEPIINNMTAATEPQSVYISDFLENIDSVQEITQRECRYISEMEAIIQRGNSTGK